MAGPDQEPADLITQLNNLTAKLSAGNDETARREALRLSRQLTTCLEDPVNIAVDLAFSPFLPTAARIAIELHLFEYIATAEVPLSSGDLAFLSEAEELLIIRILRPLAAIGFVKEDGEQRWVATALTKAMATEEIAAGHRMVGEMIVGAAIKAPKYLREAGYHCPTDPQNGFMQYAFQTKLNTFQLFSSMPRVFQDFNTFMGNTMGARSYWVDWFPVRDHLLNGFVKDEDSALVVDVGAGKGHDLAAFHSAYPNQGRLVLQELRSMIENGAVAGLDPAIELMSYDFFTEQPVKGARAYFFHHILHDWPDHICLQILAQVKAAMKPGYSKLLIHEMLIPEQGASTFHAMLDMTMMCFNAGMERTEKQWRALLEKAGLKVVKFWLPTQTDADGIVEAILEEETEAILEEKTEAILEEKTEAMLEERTDRSFRPI